MPSGPRRRPNSKRHKGPSRAVGSRPVGARKKKRAKRVSSSFSTPVASRESLEKIVRPKERPIFWRYLFALLAASLLVLVGGGHTPLALGCAVAVPGLMLLLTPPDYRMNRGMSLGFAGLCLSVVIGFLPQFYWPTARWRMEAVQTHGIDLPALLSIQPLVSLEGLVLILAGWMWFYLLSGFRINHTGWKWLYFWLACIMAVFAVLVIVGNSYGWRYPGAEGSNVFTFFPNRNQTATFLAMGGIAGFCFGVLGLHGRRSVHLAGFATSALCFYALMLGRARAGLLLLVLFAIIWLIIRLFKVRLSRMVKFAIPVGLIAASLMLVSQEETAQRIAELVEDPLSLRDEFRLLVFQDTWSMIKDAPLTGVGLGNFDAIFPQYRSASSNINSVIHPESDLLWLLSECGVLGVISLALILGAFVLACRRALRERSGHYRLIALLVVAAFLLHGLVDVPGHRPGTLFFALFFAGLALPSDSLEPSRVPAYLWRILGGVFLLIGIFWMTGSLFDWKTHSRAKSRIAEVQIQDGIASKDFIRAGDLVDDALARNPMNWRFYYQRALLELTDIGDRNQAAADFRRARFVEPTQGRVSFEEGFVWLDFDLARAVSAWRDSFFRVNINEERNFNLMLNEGLSNPLLMDRLSMLSLTHQRFRWPFLEALGGHRLIQEIDKDFAEDAGLKQFNQIDRSELVLHWIQFAEAEDVEAYLAEYSHLLKDPWQHRAEFMRSRARFLDAVEIIRASVEVAEIPPVDFDERELARVKRGFAVLPSDVVKGTALLRAYIDEEDYANALLVAQTMCEFQNPPAYAFFWKAEVLYQMGDYIESWYAFDEYLSL